VRIEFNPDELSTGGMLIAWARQQAPSGAPYVSGRCRVRLELSAEPRYANYPERNLSPDAAKLENVVARVYLAEPRCIWPDYACECGPLAERRLA
jgi:hypothetical protein